MADQNIPRQWEWEILADQIEGLADLTTLADPDEMPPSVRNRIIAAADEIASRLG